MGARLQVHLRRRKWEEAVADCDLALAAMQLQAQTALAAVEALREHKAVEAGLAAVGGDPRKQPQYHRTALAPERWIDFSGMQVRGAGVRGAGVSGRGARVRGVG
jgi:hypothetical protein